ncbi:hypothetical protein [Streptomyces sp. NBC_01235]|uniref:hypothetical protein n=1 Tax=Streptomyces sp. NBC_01235 TaxID=2903788 RepID=UPI002E149BAA|nr:hypothetical protein OG289_22795 [Streptomyces sp. NBC_01235]
MSNTEKQTTDATADIRAMENHAPILPALDDLKKPDTEKSEPVAEDEIVTLENHAPAPPALDLNGK